MKDARSNMFDGKMASKGHATFTRLLFMSGMSTPLIGAASGRYCGFRVTNSGANKRRNLILVVSKGSACSTHPMGTNTTASKNLAGYICRVR